jgi:chromosome segregation ATPase
MDFFNECTTLKERKALFWKLSKLFHPDMGGDAELFQRLKSQYDHPLEAYVPFNNTIESLEIELRGTQAALDFTLERLQFCEIALSTKQADYKTLENRNRLLNAEVESLKKRIDTIEDETPWEALKRVTTEWYNDG